jgi:hypothetical protein
MREFRTYKILRGLVLLLAGLIFGCVLPEPRPAAWTPNVVASSGCVAIDGTYENDPNVIIPCNASIIQLHQFLQDHQTIASYRQAIVPTDVTSVSVTQEDGVLLVKEHGGIAETRRLRIMDAFLYLMSMPADGIMCGRDGWLRKAAQDFGTRGFQERSVWQLLKGEDGSLLVHLLGHEDIWFRYLRLR